MSFKARRLTNSPAVTTFAWDGLIRSKTQISQPIQAAEVDAPLAASAQFAAIERDAYAKGFAEGEQSGMATGSQRADAMVARLSQTIEELAAVRAQMIRQTERQMVELALAVARRIIHREVSLDRDLLIAMSRVALDRLGESAQITVRLNPDDLMATSAERVSRVMGSCVTVVEDARLERGGCLVESDLGTLDLSVDSQIEEVARALLGARRVSDDESDQREPIRNAA